MSSGERIDCKYCNSEIVDNTAEGLQCKECDCGVHLRCLTRGSVPGGLVGDLFFSYVCQECSTTNKEHFERLYMTWLQTITLVLYHLQNKSPGIANRGFFHWKTQIAAFIDKHWAILFPKEVGRKKRWIGTISGTLSHYSPLYFTSGTSIINVSGWWQLTYASLSPSVLIQINGEMLAEKQKNKLDKVDNFALFQSMLLKKGYNYEDLIAKTNEPFYYQSYVPKIPVKHKLSNADIQNVLTDLQTDYSHCIKQAKRSSETNNQASTKAMQNKQSKEISSSTPCFDDDSNEDSDGNSETSDSLRPSSSTAVVANVANNRPKGAQQSWSDAADKRTAIQRDPMCHYNTCLQNLEHVQGITFRTRLMGGLRKEIMKSPFTDRMLKPYIRRDVKSVSAWTKLMFELECKVNADSPDWQSPKRAPIDFTYVQPEHIPAINSLCAVHFWPGIDLAETLEYPDFSCVVLYKKLIIGFAFLIPDVNINEAYISFIFTKPNWRSIGIGRFMIYHLIQTCMNKDITLHASINNPAIFLYQKFGFKVEKVVIDFYETYMRDDSKECKHAFFLRLER